MLAFLCLLVGTAHALFFNLPGKTEQCFAVTVSRGAELWGVYIVSGEGDQNVLARVTGPDGRVHFQSKPKAREGSFELTPEPTGDYRLCFQAKDSRQKTISFEFSSQEKVVEDKLATEEEMTPLKETLKQLSRNLDSVYRNIHFYERREKIHRDLAERTCDRVLWSAMGKIFVLCVISLMQIFMLRSFFDSKKSTGV
ncbi:unnamed protein product [Blepharisma stoltei]|uniref:GOLD domain-containing protein n=1 Tax=Blepharisma stoltei TaxID=1481888 RepID=A0AAU9KA51_9CILI|nr:unnamed protein product [Blepharisma stoltei]